MAAHVRLNHRICKAGEQSQRSVLDIIGTSCLNMTLVNASTAWHCIARLEVEDMQGPVPVEQDPRYILLQQQTRILLEKHLEPDETATHPRCVSTITWSFAKLRVHDQCLFRLLADLGVRWLEDFKPFELANVLWGFGKLQVNHGRFFKAAHDHLLHSAKLFSSRSLSMAAWAFATVRTQPCRSLLGRLAGPFVAGLSREEDATNPVTLANMVWAFATARTNVKRETLWVIASTAERSLQNFKAHELSIMLWAFARLNACHNGLFTEAAGLLCTNTKLRDEVHSQGIANLLWAFARHEQDSGKSATAKPLPDVLTALLPTCFRLLPTLNAVELSSWVWAISKLASRQGNHQAADRLLLAGAQLLLREPQRLAGLSMSGAAGVLSAFSEFYSGAAGTPEPCRALMPRLVKLCASFGPEAQEEQSWDLADDPTALAAAEPPTVLAAAEPFGDAQLAAATAAQPPRLEFIARANAAGHSRFEALAQHLGMPHIADHTGPLKQAVAQGGNSSAATAAPAAPAPPQAPAAPVASNAQVYGAWHANGQETSQMPRPLRAQLDMGLDGVADPADAMLERALATGRRLPAGEGAKRGPRVAFFDKDSPFAPQVPTTKLATTGRRSFAPTLSFVPEFTSSGSDEDNLVTIAFEVNSSGEVEIASVAVEVCVQFVKHDSFDMPLSDDGALGMYTIRVPKLNGRWSVRLTMLDAVGLPVGDATAISFFTKAPIAAKVSDSIFGSTTSTCAPTDAGGAASPCGASCAGGFADWQALYEAAAQELHEGARSSVWGQ